MLLPSDLIDTLSGRSFEPILDGESGAAVWRCVKSGWPSLYLKTAALDHGLHLDGEARRLEWMEEYGIAVPRVHACGSDGHQEYLLLDEVPGLAASDSMWACVPGEVVAAMGDGLRRLHQTDVSQCPFDHRVARQIEEARANLVSGRVREDDFDESRAGRCAGDLFAELITSIPPREDLVFTHGDFCLPNIMLRRRERDGRIEIAGLIDCGRAGIADRHQDLALAARSIAFNLGAEYLPAFHASYGLPHPRAETLDFFVLLDEFF